MRVRTNQTDLNGSMYHGAFFDCFEAARVDVFRRLGYTYERTLSEGFVPVVRRASCDYRRAAFMDQEFVVTVSVKKMTAATLAVGYEASVDSLILANGEVVFAFLDRAGKLIRIPSSLRQCVEDNRDLLSPP